MKLSVLLLASALSGFAFAETTTTNSNNSSLKSTDSSSSTATPYAPTDSSSSWNSSSPSNSLNSPSTVDSRTGSATTSPTNSTSPATSGSNMNSTNTDSNLNSATTDNSTETTSRTYREETLAPRGMWGGFYIEPGIFGSRNETDLKAAQLGAGSVNGTSDGVGLDLKIGGHFSDAVFVALDGRYERSRLAGSSYSKADSNVYNWGPTLGFQAPVWGMRLWGTYVVDGINDPEAGANNADFRFKNPYGWRAGVGFHIQNVSLNLEYEDLTYRNTDIQSAGNAGGAPAAVDFSQRGALASLSFPVSL